MTKKRSTQIVKPKDGITVESILEDLVFEAKMIDLDQCWYPEDYSSSQGKLAFIRDLYYRITGESLRINGVLV